jgi:hypothetical protein
MSAVICSHASAGARLTKPASIPQTPLVPVFGARPLGHQRVQHAAAFSLNRDQLPQGPFSFISERFSQGPFNRPDVPKGAAEPAARGGATAEVQPDESLDSQPAPSAPRFRSALEQVSYLTNQSAMRAR